MFVYKMSFKGFVRKVIATRQDINLDLESRERLVDPELGQQKKQSKHKFFKRNSSNLISSSVSKEKLKCEFCKGRGIVYQAEEEIPVVVVHKDSSIDGEVVDNNTKSPDTGADRPQASKIASVEKNELNKMTSSEKQTAENAAAKEIEQIQDMPSLREKQVIVHNISGLFCYILKKTINFIFVIFSSLTWSSEMVLIIPVD